MSNNLLHALPVLASEYYDNTKGWLVESTAYHPYPAIPAWDEQGYPSLCDVFETEQDAWDAIMAA